MALNDAGLVTGFSDNASNDPHAFVWTRAGGIRDLGTLGGIGSYAIGIDAAGQVAGYSVVAGTEFHYHAFRWTAAGGMRDLATLGGSESFSSPSASLARLSASTICPATCSGAFPGMPRAAWSTSAAWAAPVPGRWL